MYCNCSLHSACLILNSDMQQHSVELWQLEIQYNWHAVPKSVKEVEWQKYKFCNRTNEKKKFIEISWCCIIPILWLFSVTVCMLSIFVWFWLCILSWCGKDLMLQHRCPDVKDSCLIVAVQGGHTVISFRNKRSMRQRWNALFGSLEEQSLWDGFWN